jgi:phosphoglycolate phosphatase
MSIGDPARDDSCRSRGHERKVDRGQVDPIIFDFDGVLVDTAEDIATAANAVLQHYRRPAASLERVRSYIGGRAESLLRELLWHADEDPPSEAVAMFKMNYSECYDEHTQLYPGVRNALKRLLAGGKHMAIATNKIESITQALIRRLGLEPYFLVVVG